MDRAKINAFLDQFVEMAAGATTIGLLAVADRSGLSRHLGEVGGGTAEELAEGADLDQRYVQEILSGLAAAGVVGYEPASGRFDLPPEKEGAIYRQNTPSFSATRPAPISWEASSTCSPPSWERSMVWHWRPRRAEACPPRRTASS
jgi:hypothetical protein